LGIRGVVSSEEYGDTTQQQRRAVSQFGERAPVEQETPFPRQPFALPISRRHLRESSSVGHLDIFYAIAET
jgi:hypothetical protein